MVPPITLSAYDISDALIESVSISGVNVAGWRTNFLGLENAGIAKVRFNSDYLVPGQTHTKVHISTRLDIG